MTPTNSDIVDALLRDFADAERARFPVCQWRMPPTCEQMAAAHREISAEEDAAMEELHGPMAETDR